MPANFDQQIESLKGDITSIQNALDAHRQGFIRVGTEFTRNFYEETLKREVTNNHAITAKHGSDGIAKMKARLKELQDRAPTFLTEHVDKDVLWAHRSNDPSYSHKKVEESMRFCLGMLGEILEEFGYHDPKSREHAWREYDASGNNKIMNGRRRYPYGLEYSRELKQAEQQYTSTLLRMAEKQKELRELVRKKGESEAADLWDKT